MKRPYIVYSLSKDRTTQRFNKSKFQDIIKDIETFLRSCNTININEPDDIELTAYTAYDDSDPAGILIDIINKTTKRFGSSDQEPIAYHYPSGKPHSTSKYKWKFSKEKLQEVINYIVENSPMQKSNFGPLELYLSYDFKFIDLVNREELPNQEHISSLLIWFTRGKACSPSLFFPFEQADEEFWNYIDRIIPFLPIRLEEKYLKIAHVNKQGEIKGSGLKCMMPYDPALFKIFMLNMGI
jgi:hypothetical protein